MFTAIIVVIIVLLVLLLLFLLLTTKASVPAAAVEFIAIAERSGATGPEKMAQVVAALAAYVPAGLRGIFTNERLQALAQKIFVWMRKYAEAYRKASQDAAPGAAEADLNGAALEILIADLLKMGITSLNIKAAEYGIDVPPDATEKQLALAIIRATLEKST